jgi:phage portal protein BeeE
MGEESVRKARLAWRATHEGHDGGGQTAILYDGADFKPFTLASTDAQFLENRKFQILEIARAFRVPPSMLFDLTARPGPTPNRWAGSSWSTALSPGFG